MTCPYRFGICTMEVLMGMFVGTFVLLVRDGRKRFAASLRRALQVSLDKLPLRIPFHALG
jgi:hypothetical protein